MLTDLFACANNTELAGNAFACLLIDCSAYLFAIASLYLYRCKTKVTFVGTGFMFENADEYLTKISAALDMLGVDPVNVVFKFLTKLFWFSCKVLIHKKK